jgi:hypothetical protein
MSCPLFASRARPTCLSQHVCSREISPHRVLLRIFPDSHSVNFKSKAIAIGVRENLLFAGRRAEKNMAYLYFHYGTGEVMLEDQRGNEVRDLTEAREHADNLVRAFLATPDPEDWREWILLVSDEEGDVLLNVPFSAVLGRPH